ncbi:glycine betaine ABC transporter substrate-binding protein [Clostridium grantii]|uniref:Osmoprotectant transport system permease protein n=1 Tax=Clostridium grantii DSM 8605 TaxID=1121316 RepID=A0A1M5XU54_9CLOT|nr:glycine betaine ABC transporter substrate-binding protein [Clostridium grantii]SHI03269.1 osmoprotectant transport system permease protein [Clostridium grantii DSM 8605]
MDFFNYFLSRIDQVGDLFFQHIMLTVMAVLVAVVVGVPIGILITKNKKLASPVIGVANVIQAVPSLALLGFLIPVLGIGSTPAIVMVFLYSLLPIVKNTYTGLANINPDMLEAAKGMGMTKSQMLRRVQLPLALPVIMAGIRIAAVTAVGLMTIAAFIGAGGLGYMVFTGVQTVNNNMILAGAIPACILALFMDFVIGKIENIVTPEGIKANKGKIVKNKKMKSLISLILIGIILVSSIVYFFNSNKSAKDTIVIASKNYNEQLILGNIMATLIEEKTDLNVDRKLNLGGSSIVFEAIKAGDVDIYVEYSGTALVSIMEQSPIVDKEEAYNVIQDYFNKEYNLKFLKSLGFNNTYVLAVRNETAEEYGLESISDLARVSPDMILGSTMEFSEREDGYLGLQKLYNLNFSEVKGIDGGLRYTALNEKNSDVTDAFSTDGLLKKFGLKTLEDDMNFFPGYYAIPLVRQETLEEYPELEEVLNLLENKISEDQMIDLNYQVDEGADPRKVADQFLKDIGLIE